MKINVDIKELHDFVQHRKSTKGIYVQTPSGKQPILETVKKSKVNVVEIEFPTHKRIVAETHRFSNDGKEVFAKDANYVDTVDGKMNVVSKKFLTEQQDVYDIMIDNPHWYFDQHGVIHHNTGKSLGLCSLAADYLMQGYNVLYVSMEMAEEVCAKRIDANILDVSLDDIDDGLITKGDFMNRFKVAKGKTSGRLIVRQFPTGGANVNHLNVLMQDLQMKQNFKPDIVILDYLGIMASSRMGFSENSYTMVKAIAEEVRGFAIEHDVAVWSAAQTNRNGWDNTDVQLADIGESAGIAHTVDFMITVMEDDDLAQQGLQLVKQLKSRYADKSKWNKFTMSVSKGNQRWTDVVHEDSDLNDALNKNEMRQTESQRRREKMKEVLESDEGCYD